MHSLKEMSAVASDLWSATSDGWLTSNNIVCQSNMVYLSVVTSWRWLTAVLSKSFTDCQSHRGLLVFRSQNHLLHLWGNMQTDWFLPSLVSYTWDFLKGFFLLFLDIEFYQLFSSNFIYLFFFFYFNWCSSKLGCCQYLVEFQIKSVAVQTLLISETVLFLHCLKQQQKIWVGKKLLY